MKNTDKTKTRVICKGLIPLSSACILSICGLIAPNYCLNGRYRPRCPEIQPNPFSSTNVSSEFPLQPWETNWHPTKTNSTQKVFTEHFFNKELGPYCPIFVFPILRPRRVCLTTWRFQTLHGDRGSKASDFQHLRSSPCFDNQ